MSLPEISYQIALHALDVQERAVDQLRSRAGILLAASSLTASFLGAQTIQRSNGLDFIGLLALISLAFSILGCVFVLVPKRGFVFGLSGPAVYETLFEFADDTDEVHRRLAYWLQGYWLSNQTIIEGLGRYFAASALALTMQLALWCTALARSV